MSLNNVLSLNGVIKQNNITNVNSNVFSNPYSNINQIDYSNQNSIDTTKYNLNSINLEKTSLELSLNVLGIEHNKYETMSKHEFLYYYENFKKQNSNINKILASKIALKYKLGSNDDMNYSGINVLNHSMNNFNNEQNNNFYQPEKYQQHNSNTYNLNMAYQPNNFQQNNQNNQYNQNNQNNQNNQYNQSQLNSYGTESTIPEYTRAGNNTNIQKARQTINTSTFSTPNNKSQAQTQPQTQPNKVDNQLNFIQQQSFKPNFRPIQTSAQESNPNKYLSIANPTPAQPMMDKNSRDFDLNSIIDNYAKQKNSGVTGKNLDVSFNVTYK